MRAPRWRGGLSRDCGLCCGHAPQGVLAGWRHTLRDPCSWRARPPEPFAGGCRAAPPAADMTWIAGYWHYTRPRLRVDSRPLGIAATRLGVDAAGRWCYSSNQRAWVLRARTLGAGVLRTARCADLPSSEKIPKPVCRHRPKGGCSGTTPHANRGSRDGNRSSIQFGGRILDCGHALPCSAGAGPGRNGRGLRGRSDEDRHAKGAEDPPHMRRSEGAGGTAAAS